MPDDSRGKGTVIPVRRVEAVPAEVTSAVPRSVNPPDGAAERLIKSADRVRDLGEVFTPRRIVDDMLNLLPDEVWSVFPQKTFLEPACGDGNFIVAILERKLDAVAEAWRSGALPAGDTAEALHFHSLAALSSLYGVDISADNVVGATLEHPLGARARTVDAFQGWLQGTTGRSVTSRSRVMQCAVWVASANIVVADMVSASASGAAGSSFDVPLVEYEWNPAKRRVTLTDTSIGQLLNDAESAAGDFQASLFGPEEPVSRPAIAFLDLHKSGRPGHNENPASQRGEAAK